MDFCLLLCCFDVQSDTLSYSFWTSACFPTALTSNPPRFLAPFGPQPASPQLQRPIRHGFLLLLDFCHASRSFNVQSTTLSCSFWISAMLPAASTSNLSRFLAPFGPLPTSPQLQRPIRHAFLLLLDFSLLPRSFNVQSVTLSCSFWTSTCLPQLQRPIRHAFLLLLDLSLLHPLLQRPIRHAFLLLLDFCLLSRSFNVQSTMHPSHTCLPTTTSSSQRKKATPAHQCQHCFISFNSLLIRLFNLITIPLFFSFP